MKQLTKSISGFQEEKLENNPIYDHILDKNHGLVSKIGSPKIGIPKNLMVLHFPDFTVTKNSDKLLAICTNLAYQSHIRRCHHLSKIQLLSGMHIQLSSVQNFCQTLSFQRTRFPAHGLWWSNVKCSITPFTKKNKQPSLIDIHLSPNILMLKPPIKDGYRHNLNPCSMKCSSLILDIV